MSAATWKFNEFPCPKDWPHKAHRWTKHHRPGVAEAVWCVGIPDPERSERSRLRVCAAIAARRARHDLEGEA